MFLLRLEGGKKTSDWLEEYISPRRCFFLVVLSLVSDIVDRREKNLVVSRINIFSVGKESLIPFFNYNYIIRKNTFLFNINENLKFSKQFQSNYLKINHSFPVIDQYQIIQMCTKQCVEYGILREECSLI